MPTHVLIADDHQLVRQALKALLEREGFKVVGEAENGQQALKIVEELHPEVAVLDIVMPVLNGVDAAREIQRISPHTKTILLTVQTEHRYILEGFRNGAKGFVMKTYATEDLVRAIHEAARGGTYLSPEVSDVLVESCRDQSDVPCDPLTARERQVLQLVAEGNSTKEVANTLGISVKTAETYRSRIMEKLKMHETASLVRYAIRRGLIQP